MPSIGADPASSSPRPWGCFWLPRGPRGTGSVFPTPVGVFPDPTPTWSRRPRLPHARGGVSRRIPRGCPRPGSSPRPWGCFYYVLSDAAGSLVFPTPVGVFPCGSGLTASKPRLPHARGGVSGGPGFHQDFAMSSPRPWGCFLSRSIDNVACSVFLTPVGVFRRRQQTAQAAPSLPHARGGVSIELV